MATKQNYIRINSRITAPELRVIDATGKNLGLLTLQKALEAAAEQGQDLIEISPNAMPPVAKIMDFGKFSYEEAKKHKAAKAKSKTSEVKSVQVKIGTSEHDLGIKAKKASEWLAEGHRVRVELFLVGRSKYMDFGFLKERLERMLKLLSVSYKIADPPKKGLKGIVTVIEKS